MVKKSATKMKERETSDTSYSRKCIYCFEFIEGGVHKIFDHINNDHCFNFGKPENLVFAVQLLDILDEKFEK